MSLCLRQHVLVHAQTLPCILGGLHVKRLGCQGVHTLAGMGCAGIASPKLRLKEAVWETAGVYMPVNRVEAGMHIERHVKDAVKSGSFDLQPKAIAHAEGTNMVCPHNRPCG
jgi:hypothetical protein